MMFLIHQIQIKEVFQNNKPLQSEPADTNKTFGKTEPSCDSTGRYKFVP